MRGGGLGWGGVEEMVGDGVGEEGKLFHHHSNSCIKMGRDESHFKVPLIVRGKI